MKGQILLVLQNNIHLALLTLCLKHSTHIEACKTLSKNKALNHKLALDTYEYGLTKSKGNILKSWNVYNTGDVKTVNDRIYQMKGIIMVLEKEVKANKIEEYRLALL